MIRAERPAKSMPHSKAPVLTAPVARRQTARAFVGRREPAAVRGSGLAVGTPDGAARCGRITRDALECAPSRAWTAHADDGRSRPEAIVDVPAQV